MNASATRDMAEPMTRMFCNAMSSPKKPVVSLKRRNVSMSSSVKTLASGAGSAKPAARFTRRKSSARSRALGRLVRGVSPSPASERDQDDVHQLAAGTQQSGNVLVLELFRDRLRASECSGRPRVGQARHVPPAPATLLALLERSSRSPIESQPYANAQRVLFRLAHGRARSPAGHARTPDDSHR